MNPAPNIADQSTQDYPSPPVHEVVIDLHFATEVGEDQIRALGKTLKGKFQLDTVHEINSSEVLITSGPTDQHHRMRKQFEGWSFRSTALDWILNVQRKQLTLHAVRPGKWPKGPYVGWKTIFLRFAEIHGALENVYREVDLKRVGLRYLNRIAIPLGADVDHWFTWQLQYPDFLDGLHAFDYKQTWATAGPDQDIGSTIRLTTITIEDEVAAEGNFGVLLDIDIFNLFIRDAPSYDEVPGWYERAHDVEHKIFEASVTDLARESFNVTA